MNRRAFIASAAAGFAHLARGQTVPGSIQSLKPMLDGVQPITNEERAARIEKARRLMRENKLDAILLEPGTSLYYYTGQRGTGMYWILPASGEPIRLSAPAENEFQALAKALPAGNRIGV